jgi:hypothetical protein
LRPLASSSDSLRVFSPTLDRLGRPFVRSVRRNGTCFAPPPPPATLLRHARGAGPSIRAVPWLTFPSCDRPCASSSAFLPCRRCWPRWPCWPPLHRCTNHRRLATTVVDHYRLQGEAASSASSSSYVGAVSRRRINARKKKAKDERKGPAWQGASDKEEAPDRGKGNGTGKGGACPPPTTRAPTDLPTTVPTASGPPTIEPRARRRTPRPQEGAASRRRAPCSSRALASPSARAAIDTTADRRGGRRIGVRRRQRVRDRPPAPRRPTACRTSGCIVAGQHRVLRAERVPVACATSSRGGGGSSSSKQKQQQQGVRKATKGETRSCERYARSTRSNSEARIVSL